MELKLFEKYLLLCRKHGVEELKIGEIAVKLSKEAPKSRYKEKQALQNAPSRQDVQPQYSDMDVLFWSTGGVAPMNEGPDA